MGLRTAGETPVMPPSSSCKTPTKAEKQLNVSSDVLVTTIHRPLSPVSVLEEETRLMEQRLLQLKGAIRGEKDRWGQVKSVKQAAAVCCLMFTCLGAGGGVTEAFGRPPSLSPPGTTSKR